MSEPQNPVEMKNPEATPDTSGQLPESGEVSTQTDRPKKTTSPLKLPDFKPLGNVRDYFTEQMRQDSIYRN